MVVNIFHTSPPSMSPLPNILAAIGGLCLLPATFGLNLGFPYGSEKVRGVNLGGWLVLEVRHMHSFQWSPTHGGHS